MSNIESTEARDWVKYLTDAELAYWEAKPQSEKDWWDANTKPEDRPQILRTEIAVAANYESFLRLPSSTREAITKRLEEEADAARIRIRQQMTTPVQVLIGTHHSNAVMSQLPSDSEIVPAVEALFAATASLDRTALWNALVPTDADLRVDLPPDQKVVTYIPSYEFRELLDFVNYFGKLVGIEGQSEGDEVRVKLMLYCHIMESEFMPTLIWNQLRLLSGLTPSWSFVRTTLKGKTEVCEYPWQKFEEIEKLSAAINQPIGNLINGIWKRDLRNAFFHSRYFLGSAYVVPTGQLSPVSRKRTSLASTRQARSYSFDEIHELYRCAQTLAFTVASKHSEACKTFKQMRRRG